MANLSEDGFLSVLIGAKALRALGLFIAYDLLKEVHIVLVLFWISFISSLFLVIIQKPFTSGPRLTKHQWFSVFRQALVSVCLGLVWLYGLTLCGPLRTILVTEQSAATLIAGLAAGTSASPSKTRGVVFFIGAVLALLLVDHDDNSPHHQAYHAGHADHHAEFYTFFTHMFSWTDISDHKGGVLLLCLFIGLQAGANWSARRSAVVIGGGKRLHALVSLVATVLLSPWAFYHYVGHTKEASPGLGSYILSLVMIALTVKLIDFYADSAAHKKLETNRASRWSSLSSFAFAFLIGCLWTHPIVYSTVQTAGGGVEVEDHQISPGVVFAAVLFCFAALNLTSGSRSGTRGYFVGYSATGLPLYNLTTDSIHEAGQSVLRVARQGLKQILAQSDSRRIFYFLLLNLGFTFVEFAYGVWTNSLGLISDGFHMLFDCSALVMGLYAAVMSKWKPTKSFSFGYGRLEVLSGFVNGLFLAIIALNVFVEGLRRLFDPPNVGTDRLFAVSLAGLIVNLIGIAAFSFGGASHSHGGGSSHGHSHNANMRGVFLHILADTLGSVGVIISSLLIEYYGLLIADPICSLFIAVTIGLSVVPLLKDSALVLLLAIPPESREAIQSCLHNLLDLDGVKGHRSAYFWIHANDKIHGNVCLNVDSKVNAQEITETVYRRLVDAGVNFPVVQIEKDEFYHHLQGLGTKFLT